MYEAQHFRIRALSSDDFLKDALKHPRDRNLRLGKLADLVPWVEPSGKIDAEVALGCFGYHPEVNWNLACGLH